MPWGVVARFSEPAKRADQEFALLDRMSREAGIEATRFEETSGARALLARIGPLLKAAQQQGGSETVSGLREEDFASGAQALFFSRDAEEAQTEELLSELAGGALGLDWPEWTSIASAPSCEEVLCRSLRPFGITEAIAPQGKLSFQAGGMRCSFTLYRLPAAARTPQSPPRGTQKIPEGPGNLKRRADWFQRRSGGSK